MKQLDKDFSGLNQNFDKFNKNRQSSTWTQFEAVFVRNWQYLVRNPRSLNGILFNGTFTALLCLALYIHIGDYSKIDFNNPASYYQWIFNISGFAFLLSNNISFSSSSSVII